MSFKNFDSQSGVFIGDMKKELMEDGDSNENLQDDDQLNLQGVLIRTVTDLQVMKEKYEGGLSVYNKLLDVMELSEDLEVARQMMKTGLEVHVSLLSFTKSACQLVGVGTEWIEVKEEPDLDTFLKMETEADLLPDMIEVKTEITDLKPQDYLDQMKESFEEEKKLSGDEKPHKCNQCDKSYKRKQHLNDHKRLKHGSTQAQLKKEALTSQYMGVNSQIVPEDLKKEDFLDGTDPALSGLNSTNGEDLDSSENGKKEGKQRKERPFLCLICNKTFIRQRGLKAHVEQVHINPARSEEKPHKCDMCQISFRKKSRLLYHLKTHQCVHCNQQFTSKEEKRQHMHAQHFEPKTKEVSQFICSTCGYTSLIKKNFQQHILIHEEKKHSCPYCQKLFTLKHSLTEHIRIHTGEKPIVCQLCGMRFRKSSGLSKHKIIHTGERPFECELCGKGFTQRGNLKTHMKSHAAGTIPPIIKVDRVESP